MGQRLSRWRYLWWEGRCYVDAEDVATLIREFVARPTPKTLAAQADIIDLKTIEVASDAIPDPERATQ